VESRHCTYTTATFVGDFDHQLQCLSWHPQACNAAVGDIGACRNAGAAGCNPPMCPWLDRTSIVAGLWT
jgi:hypothetical protein